MNQYLEIKQIHEGNRGMFATKDIERNREIIQCQPFAWATLRQKKSTICNWCMMQKQLVKCSKCKCFYYCSTDCQKKDWKYHKLQCKMFEKMCTQKKLSIHQQIITQFVLHVRLWNVLNNNKELSDKFYNMCSLEDYQPLEKRQHFQELSLVLLENLGLQKNEQHLSKLIKQMHIVNLNAFTIQDLFNESQGNAVGIFQPINFFNHSCNPNCYQVFDGRYIKIIANSKIEKGQELFISYTPLATLQKQRSATLKQHYLFQCFCETCQVQKMINTEYAYIKCPDCKQSKIRKQNPQLTQVTQVFQAQQIDGFYKPQQTQKGQTQYKCTNCNKFIERQFLAGKAKLIQTSIKKIQQLQIYKQKKQYLLDLKKSFELKHPSFYKLLEDVYICGLNEALVLNNQQNQQKLFSQCFILLNEIIKHLPVWNKIQQENSINIRFFVTYNSMSKLAYHLGKMNKCLQYLQKSLKCIQNINLKNNYKQIQQLKTRYNEIKIQMSMAKTKLLK